jgi:4-amino-4-deoxy-L-arabinose transferase-like glycosyltransferase
LLAFLVLAYTYVWAIQPGYGPDEPRHFHYIRLLLDEHRLPTLVNGVEEAGAHTLHPPFYYVAVSPVFAVARGFGERAAYLAVKCVSPLIILGALLLFGSTLRRVFPERPFVAAAAFVVVALLPELMLEAAVVNNDSLAIFFGALLLWHLVRTWDEPPSLRSAVIAGLIMAAFVNTKAQGWTLTPLWAVAEIQRAVRHRDRLPAVLRDLTVGYALPLLLGTWWYVRNYQLYGQPVPLDFMGGRVQPHSSRTGELLTPLEVYTTGEAVTLGKRAAEGLFQSFWFQIDWINEEYRPAVFGVLLVLCLAALIGGLLAAWRWWSARRGGATEKPRLSPFSLLGLGFFLNWLHTWFVATFVHLGFYQGGRYLMPSVFGGGALLAAGWAVLTPRRAEWIVLGLLTLSLVGLNVLCLVELITYLNPKYVR